MGTLDPSSMQDLPLIGVSGATLIRTTCGDRHADLIRPGDLCVTRDHGPQPVRFVLTTSLSDAIRRSPDAAALRLTPRAIGPMMPRSAVVLAPDQLILLPSYLIGQAVSGVAALVPARALGGTSDAIWRDRTCDDRAFQALGFDRHEVISAAGLWIASYRPEAARMAGLAEETRAHLQRTYPQLRESRDPFPAAAYEVVSVEALLPGRA